MSLEERIRQLCNEFGPKKTMGEKSSDTRIPHFFLHRTFLGEQDLLIIFNTKRCRYNCHFCRLPAKCSKVWIPYEDILAQFEYVMKELRHSLSVLERLTLSNEGSVLDSQTFPEEALFVMARCVHELRRVHTLVVETRLEFVDPEIIRQIHEDAPRVKIDILTGFETLNPHTRNKILNKQEILEEFEAGLDRVAEVGANITAYVLFKPSQEMTDLEAFIEANNSIDYLVRQCKSRRIGLTIRLNPMYAAKGTVWAKAARSTSGYRPPRLSDVLKLAFQKTQEGVRIYIGLSAEGLDEPWGTYRSREDFSKELIKKTIRFNIGRISPAGT